MYTLFEKQLRKSGKILSLSAENIDEDIKQIDNAGFIEVRGKVVFNDMSVLKSTIENFNELGKALAYITNFSEMEKVRQQFEKAAENTKDRNQKAKLRQKLKSMTNIEKLAKELGLSQDADFLDKLAFLLKYGFQDQFAVQMSIERYTFSAECKREDLREDEHLLIRKYSRFAEKEFVLIGTIVQSSNDPIDRENYAESNYELLHPKEAVMNLVEKLSVMESKFSGKLPNEIIVDPIALYWEI